ncbi:MAG: transcriptional regulator, partial [Actinomycetota bacterium]|nr:transcriptional regulator [Actinomycetota bacterium]
MLQAIGRWGVQSPSLPTSDTLGVDTFVLGLRALFDATCAEEVRGRYELRFPQDAFDLRIAGGELLISGGPLI